MHQTRSTFQSFVVHVVASVICSQCCSNTVCAYIHTKIKNEFQAPYITFGPSPSFHFHWWKYSWVVHGALRCQSNFFCILGGKKIALALSECQAHLYGSTTARHPRMFDVWDQMVETIWCLSCICAAGPLAWWTWSGCSYRNSRNGSIGRTCFGLLSLSRDPDAGSVRFLV